LAVVFAPTFVLGIVILSKAKDLHLFLAVVLAFLSVIPGGNLLLAFSFHSKKARASA
jgi:hypothetical protein